MMPSALLSFDGFQSAPPCGGRHQRSGCGNDRVWFQSAPPCGGRLPFSRQKASDFMVSIRAPVRGATQIGWKNRFHLSSFNPRPRAGGDVASIKTRIEAEKFQSAPPCGGRPQAMAAGALRGVSIRAPVRGATAHCLGRGDRYGFQSAPPCGGRQQICLKRIRWNATK